ncbi:Integrin [Sulfitobacter noctilucicola]|uniref:VCBS repeat-containing protein n=1 Tax=Sulfitobacter noctilucicola TaxID=1342301 RepID=A0A7W6Q4L5_9RHOB|nr:VCBS repeat-containing protein [Sulfitobacter noctilucicola]KIN64519.1 Integrin [Sulfitobacter noctilucicola]MBB4174324.1 hypothetical protein [Sulfitobacter noctilucicola]
MWRAVLFGTVLAAPAAAEQITAAHFVEPTTRYAHAVLGDAIEYGALRIEVTGLGSVLVRLPKDHVFEDVAPRLWDVDGDGNPEVVVIETDVTQGAALAIYGPEGKITETPHIGRPNRWLAPIGAADLDGDGLIELAYVDRPHLAKTIRVWRFEAGALKPVADLAGFTNHRIGEDNIAGGIRTCNGGPEMIVATGDWTRLSAVSFAEDAFTVQDIGAHDGRGSFATALRCD